MCRRRLPNRKFCQTQQTQRYIYHWVMGCDVRVKELDVLLVLLAETKRKMDREQYLSTKSNESTSLSQRWSRDVEWETCGQNSDFGWTRMAEPVIKLYTESTDATSIETKETALVWQYRDTDTGF